MYGIDRREPFDGISAGVNHRTGSEVRVGIGRAAELDNVAGGR